MLPSVYTVSELRHKSKEVIQKALDGVVLVTSQRDESVVVISKQEYERLLRLEK